MRTASIVVLSSLLIGCSAPVQAQSNFGGGSGFGGGNMHGGSFGGGSAFGNGSTQMFNPGVINNPALNPYYGNGYGGGYGAGYGSGLGYSGYAPVYRAPVVMPGAPSYYRIGPLNAQYWRSPSGYYYPWGVPILGGGVANQIYYVNQGQTQQQSPPVYAMLNDMRQFLDEMKRNGRLTEADYLHLFHRVQDLQGKYDHFMAMNGTIDPADEDSVRRDAGLLGSEISQRVKPLAPGGDQGASGQTQTTGRTLTQPAVTRSGWVEEH
jgi:hypothetical protein